MVFRSFDFWEAMGYTTPWWNLWTRNNAISKEYTNHKQHFWRCWWCTGNGKNCIKKVGMKKFLGSFGKNNILFVNNMESVLILMNWKVCGYDYRSSDSGSLRGFFLEQKKSEQFGKGYAGSEIYELSQSDFKSQICWIGTQLLRVGTNLWWFQHTYLRRFLQFIGNEEFKVHLPPARIGFQAFHICEKVDLWIYPSLKFWISNEIPQKSWNCVLGSIHLFFVAYLERKLLEETVSGNWNIPDIDGDWKWLVHAKPSTGDTNSFLDQVSNEKKPGCWGCTGHYTTRIC